MKAARLHRPKEPLRIEEVAAPEPGPREVLVQVRACGLCGTDVHIAREGTVRTAYAPITLGHEPAGTVARVGPGAEARPRQPRFASERESSGPREWKEGDRVAVYPQELCGSCPFCLEGRDSLCARARVLGLQREGALAEFLSVPATSLVPLPDSVPFEQGAILADAVATPYHAIVSRGGLRAGERVAVFGCGGLGTHAVQMAKLFGAAEVIAVDVSDAALERAARAGADRTVNGSAGSPAKKIRELTGGGVDLALEFIGSAKTVDQAVKSLRRGGRAVVVGIGPEEMRLVPAYTFVGSEFQLIGSFGSNRAELEQVVGLVASGKLDLSGSVSETVSLSEVNAALEKVEKKTGNPVRVVVRPATQPHSESERERRGPNRP